MDKKGENEKNLVGIEYRDGKKRHLVFRYDDGDLAEYEIKVDKDKKRYVEARLYDGMDRYPLYLIEKMIACCTFRKMISGMVCKK